MKSKDFFALQDAYKVMYAEAKDESPEKEEEDRKKDDDLAGSPNKKKNGKKADKDYDGDGKVESSKDEYFGSKDKAIKKAMGKDVKESRWWDVDMNEAMVVTNADKKANTPAYQNFKKGLKKKDGTPMYKAADHMKEGYGKKKKKHDCASKVKHEEYGVGNCIAEMHDLDENGNVAHYDVLFEHGVEKNVPVETLQILEGHMHEHYIAEKQKDTPDQVKAVIAYDKARKGTDDATYDSEHGDKKQAKKERDYAKWQRDKGAEDAQKSGHPWEHAKGSTREKEGKKSEKHAHIKDSYDWQTESDLWDDIAEKLSELHELGGVKFKVVPFDLQEEENWIQGAVKRPGAFTKKAKAAGMSVQKFASHVDANKDKYSTRTERQANLAQTFSKMKKEGADFNALSNFLVMEGADEQAVNHIMANWVLEGYQRNPEKGEKEDRKYEKVRGERTPMPPRGNKRREEFERWYAANVR